MARKHSFACPVSPHVAWSWGLVFKDCPVVAGERDMDECRTCPLRGNVTEEIRKNRPRRDSHDRNKRKAGGPADGVDKGKTYTS